MEGISLVKNYFPDISSKQTGQFIGMELLLREWNRRINVISRKDIDYLFEHHILHSLAIAKQIRFYDNTQVLDAGTGGGFPGLPLAILFPGTQFHLVDSIGKKIRVVQTIARELGLANINAVQERAENISSKFDFVTGRAVTDLVQFMHWVEGKIKKECINTMANGIFYLKGKDAHDDSNAIKDKKIVFFPIAGWFNRPFFKDKYLVYIRFSDK